MANEIKFYGTYGRYGWLSNFYECHIEIDGKIWPTVEHYFQAMKFDDPDYRERIRFASTPKEAKALGRTRSLRIRNTWDRERDFVMLAALGVKFKEHHLRKMLIETGDSTLIEDSPYDAYWGTGYNTKGKGRNRLGELLMEVRSSLMADTDRSSVNHQDH